MCISELSGCLKIGRILSATACLALFVIVKQPVFASTVSCSTIAACVLGSNTGNGPGLEGTSVSSFGVVGDTMEQSTSVSTARAGVLGQDKSANHSIYNSGVAGTSTNGIGVLGSGGAYGAYFGATAPAGVGMYASSLSGIGVYGEGGNYGGVFVGTQDVDFGLYAAGAFIQGKPGTPTSIYGWAGDSTNTAGTGDGLNVYPDGGIGFNFNARGGAALHAWAQNIAVSYYGTTSDSFFEGTYCTADPNYKNDQIICTDSSTLDAVGNFTTTGMISSKQSVYDTKRARGSDVASFGPRSAAPSIEDFGKAKLVNGQSYVKLEPTFSSTIDATAGYMVFITAEGDSNGLFTSELSPTGFAVRENRGGHSTLRFDYRIVAKPLDTKAMHLPDMKEFQHLRKNVPVPKRLAVDQSLFPGLIRTH